MAGLSGEWVGHYVDEGGYREDGSHTFGISASLTQIGGRVSGMMTDLNPDNTIAYATLLGGPDSANLSRRDYVSIEAFVKSHPDAKFRSTLPERSRLVGRVSGGRVVWTKRYLGVLTTVTSVKGREMARHLVRNHRVRYAGTLSDDGREIAGEWTIRGRGLLGRWRVKARGEFRLTRQTKGV